MATVQDVDQQQKDFGRELHENTEAVWLTVQQLGTWKALTADQQADAAETFDATTDSVRGRKKLVDRSIKVLKDVSSVISRTREYWRSRTVPYVESGVRLIKRDTVEKFEQDMTKLLDELTDAVADANNAWPDIINDARARLGHLFNEADYPPSLIGSWKISWGYTSFEPSSKMEALHPELFRRETERIKQRFNRAVELAEQQFAEELQRMLATLVDRLGSHEVETWQCSTQVEEPDRHELSGMKEEEAGINDLIAERDQLMLRVLTDEEQERLQEVQQTIISDTESDQRRLLIEQLEGQLARWEDFGVLSKAEVIDLYDDGRLVAEREKETSLRLRFETVDEGREWLTERGCTFTRRRHEEKTFRTSTVDNLQDFFERFRSLNIGSNPDLDRVIEETEQVMEGRNVDSLRGNHEQRVEVQESLRQMAERLEDLAVAKPRRKFDFND
jgi:hypothetical protein